MRTPLRVLVISPRNLIRDGLAALLRGQPQINLVGQVDNFNVVADDSDVALWDVSNHKPQSMPFRFLALLREPDDSRAWLEAGAAGIVLETASIEELLNAIRQVARGEIYLPSSIAKQVVSTLVTSATSRELIEPMTDRERQVLALLAQGLSNKDIAQTLYVSVRTVEGHLANIYGKLRVKSRTEAALWAVQRGLDKA